MSYYTFFEQVAARGLWFVFGHIFVIIATLLLAVLAYKRNPRNLNNRSFVVLNMGFLTLAITMWLSDFLFLPYFIVLMITRATWVAGFMIGISLLHFAYTFPDQNKNYPRYFWPFIFISLVFSVIAMTTPLLVESFTIKNGNMIVNGHVGFFHGVVFFTYLFAALNTCIVLVKKIKRLKGRQRVQLKYFFLGILAFLVYAFATDLIPQMFGNQEWSRYGALGIIFSVGFTAYAVIKHRLMDIRALVLRSVTYSVTVSLIVGAYVLIAYSITARYQDINLINVITLIALLAMYNPLRRFVEKHTDKLFFKGRYNFQELVTKINDIITKNSRNVAGLTKDISEVLLTDMKASSAAFHLVDQNKENGAIKLVKNKNGALVADELEDDSKGRAALSRIGAEVLLCIRTEERCEAVLALGPKKSGDMYSVTDLKLLELVAPQIAIALENARLYEQAITDGLTGLYHQRYFHIRLSEELSKAQRYQLPLSLIMLDLDYFKQVNDKHGHQVGDKVLIELSGLIKENVRSCDIVGRYGGDEFVILLPVVSKDAAAKKYKTDADQIIERLTKVIEEHSFTNLRLKLKASLGIVVYDGIAKTTPDELIKKADELLYQAKEGGRNTVCIEDFRPPGQIVA